MNAVRPFPLLFALAVLAGCVSEAPPYREVVTMKAGDAAAAASGYPAPGTVWRLDERDLRALSPAPVLEPPPPPRRPPPRPNEPPAYYGPYHGPYYGPYYGPPY